MSVGIGAGMAAPLSPAAQLRRMMQGYIDTQLLYVAAKLGLADALAGGPREAGDLAMALNADRYVLPRILRALVSRGVLHEEGGRYSLSSLGEKLQTSRADSLHDVVLWHGEEDYRAWGDLLRAVLSGQPAFEQAFGLEFFAYLAQHTPAHERFQSFMHGVAARIARALLRNYDFSRARRIIDVGGGDGSLLAAILGHCPDSSGTILERPHVLYAAERVIARAGVQDRCALQVGDFFTAVPRGGDLYLLSQILHDWDDARCGQILARCREAMGERGVLLVIEQLVDGGEMPHVTIESDLHMLVLTGGKERTEAAYRALFADAGLLLDRVLRTQSPWSILEVGAQA